MKFELTAASLALILLPTNALHAARLNAEVSDSDGKPVADAVVFVSTTFKEKFEAPQRPYSMDQVDKEFVPHLLPILIGSQVRFPNKDKIHHELYSFSPAKTFELPLYKGEPAQPIQFDTPGVVQLGCNIHDWMSGVVLVLPNPYFAKTGTDGSAVIDNIPAGEDLQVGVFHERLKGKVEETLRKVKLDGNKPENLQWSITLKPEHKKRHHSVGYR